MNDRVMNDIGSVPGSDTRAPGPLTDLQFQFRDCLLHSQSGIKKHIISTEDLSNIERLAIYGNGYYLRLVEVLQGDYSALAALLGEDGFTQLATGYIDSYPSTFPSLRYFGQYMEKYLAGHENYREFPYLQELARFEWAFADAFDAPDMPVVSEHQAADVPPGAWPGLQMKFQASIQLVPYQWNIISLWQAADGQKPLPLPERLHDPELCMVWRNELLTQFRTLENDEALVLPEAMQETDFSSLCDILAQHSDDPEEVPMRAASLLKGWLSAGLVSELVY